MKKANKMKLYLDTSIISAFFDERNPDRMWWTRKFWGSIEQFDVFISDVVIAEIQETPDLELRERMMQIAKDLNALEFNEEAQWLSNEYIRYGAVPERYKRDAFHIGIATANNMDILVSWNYKHIVRRKTRKIVRIVNELYDYYPLEIVAPPEILEGEE